MNQETALKVLKSEHNVFITGAAGTGKTYLLNQFIDYLKKEKKEFVITAPTGISASHLQNGVTIHSFFCLGIRKFISNAFLVKLKNKKDCLTKIRKIKVLIIDEISMVSPRLFEMIDTVLQFVRSESKPFGGVKVVLSGDFFQLPPILDDDEDRETRQFAWQSRVWKDLDFRTCYLIEKFRQKDESKLISILDDIRSGYISQTTHELLQSRLYKELKIDYKPTKLFTHNANVDAINNRELEKLEEKEHFFFAETKGRKKEIERIFKNSLVLEELTLKKGAVVIFIKNNQGKGYINGTTGTVVGFNKDDMPIVKTKDNIRIPAYPEDWKITENDDKVVAQVSQIPLRLAWALTIHKSQGLTLDVAEIDLSKTFEYGQGYVALSRIRDLEGLKLLGINNLALQVNPIILKIDHRIHNASKRAEDELNSDKK
jgi:ATP-dependent exoDNAse (exonuclease V) alpha subunit